VGAILIGVGAPRWLKSEHDKNLLLASAAAAAEAQPVGSGIPTNSVGCAG